VPSDDSTTVVIATLDDGDALSETVRSILQGSITPREIVIVDDGSRIAARIVVDDMPAASRIRIVHSRRQGVARARNLGASLSQGERLVFLDGHCVVESGWLSSIDEALDAYPDGVFAPSIRDMDDEVFGCGARLISPELRIRWLTSDLTRTTQVPIAPGGCLALSKVTFERIGPFASYRQLGLEDVEFSLRAWRLGLDVLSVHGARLAHRFRDRPAYPLDPSSRGFNLACLALVHLPHARRAMCLRTIVGSPRASEVLVDAFCGSWEEERRALDARSVRNVEEFFERFGEW
jgi:glycosyltransferase involved in cell wall biosynthesis